jgi:hypothetical protein
MRALHKKTGRGVPQTDREHKVIPFPVQGEGEATARILAEFAGEAREVLDRLEESAARLRAREPGKRMRRDVLRFLDRGEEWVDVHDLPIAGAPGRAASRTLARQLAEDGLAEMERDETYPNMARVRITAAGREALRRMAVSEAMELLRGIPGGATEREVAVREALAALRRVGALEGSR